MLRVVSLIAIFVLGSVVGFWIGSQPQAAAKSVAHVCGLADTSAGQMLDQAQVDRVVHNLADALSVDAEDRADLAAAGRRHQTRCAQALAQLDVPPRADALPPAVN